MSANLNDRVRVVSYSDDGYVFPAERLALIVGQEGTVIDPEADGYIEVAMDNAPVGVKNWIFRPDEVEVI